MSVTIRRYRRGGWEVDILWRSPTGRRLRERRRLSMGSKTTAQRWGDAREQELMLRGYRSPAPPPPTLSDFWPRFIDGHARANRHKPSSIAAKETIGRVHLLPMLGAKRLDAITSEQIQRLKLSLQGRSAKTVNNVLTVLNTLLKKAVEWQVISQVPCTIRLLPVPLGSADFYDFSQYESLVSAAAAFDRRAHLLVLLGGEAGLRCGEMMALEWRDVNLQKNLLCVERSDWKGQVTTTKGGRLRYVPMTVRLAEAIRTHRHLKSELLLCRADGTPLTQKVVQDLVRTATRRAGLERAGVHMLRHTFCSHLAMRGAPARAIQELAGHVDLGTTQRYMHLTPAATASAIQLLDRDRDVHPTALRHGHALKSDGENVDTV